MTPIFGVAAARRDDLVELVGAHEGEHGVALEVVQARFHGRGWCRSAGCSGRPAACVKSFRRDDLDAVERAVDHRRSTPTVSCMHLSAAQAPVKRDIAQP